MHSTNIILLDWDTAVRVKPLMYFLYPERGRYSKLKMEFQIIDSVTGEKKSKDI